MQRTGKCLCGAVEFTAKEIDPDGGMCHCDMCRRWTGSFLMTASSDHVTWSGGDRITRYQSSEWAERGFCSVCGSSLFYRVTAPGPYHGTYHLGLGTLDDAAGFDLKVEYFIDKKPACYAIEGDRETLTEAEVFAKFGGG